MPKKNHSYKTRKKTLAKSLPLKMKNGNYKVIIINPKLNSHFV